MIACNECKGTNISEKMWVETNDFLLKKGKTYYAIDFELLENDTDYYCKDCREYPSFVHDNEDKESEVA